MICVCVSTSALVSSHELDFSSNDGKIDRSNRRVKHSTAAA